MYMHKEESDHCIHPSHSIVAPLSTKNHLPYLFNYWLIMICLLSSVAFQMPEHDMLHGYLHPHIISWTLLFDISDLLLSALYESLSSTSTDIKFPLLHLSPAACGDCCLPRTATTASHPNGLLPRTWKAEEDNESLSKVFEYLNRNEPDAVQHIKL